MVQYPGHITIENLYEKCWYSGHFFGFDIKYAQESILLALMEVRMLLCLFYGIFHEESK